MDAVFNFLSSNLLSHHLVSHSQKMVVVIGKISCLPAPRQSLCNSLPLSSCPCPLPSLSTPNDGPLLYLSTVNKPSDLSTSPVMWLLSHPALLVFLLPLPMSQAPSWVFLFCQPKCISQGPLLALPFSLSQDRAISSAAVASHTTIH